MIEHRMYLAIVMLNPYPVEVVLRAIESIRRQATPRRWTLYLGFHNRPPAHRRAVRSACAGLPLHFVTLRRDYVFDARARDVVLQEALARGAHRFLAFLDDDDEWYSDYVEAMTAFDAPFVTCAKDVVDADSGSVTTVGEDIDYEGMMFSFAAWGSMRLPFFAKQGTDKLVCREFCRRYPDHPHVGRPLYRVHRHADSLTATKVLGRGGSADDRFEFVAVAPRSGHGPTVPRDLRVVASALGTRPRPLDQAGTAREHRRVCLAPLPLVPACRKRADRTTARARTLVVGIVGAPVEWMAARSPNVRRRWFDALRQADALLPCEPLWADAFEAVGAHVFPLGLPSLASEDRIEARAAISSRPRVERLCVPAADAAARRRASAVAGYLGDVALTTALRHADLCWCPDSDARDWGADVLRSYEAGVPCLASARTTAAKVLLGHGFALADQMSPSAIADRVRAAAPDAGRAELVANLPLFRRCYTPFYWRNALEAHCRTWMAQRPA